MQKLNQTIAKQKGAVLILLAFIIGLGVLAYLLHAFDPARLKLEQDKKTYETLNKAKEALIAWAVSHPNTPGMMPWPDRNADLDFAPYSNAYDGRSDCVTTAFSRPYLLGQLPWRGQSNPCTLPHTGLGAELTDAQGNHLWYAVSRNLVHDYEHGEAPIINPGMINAPHAITPYLRQGGTESYPWLEVLDRNGNLVSDRVVAVIIAPGNSIGTQDRSAPAPNPSEFLDSFRIGAATYNNSNYSVINEDFVIGDDSRNVSASDPTFVKPYNFNDKLVFITIDELMAALEKRVGEEVRANLKTYAAANAGNYPYASVLGGVGPALSRKYRCTTGNLMGALPVNSPIDICTYAATATTVNSVCNFQDITSVAFRKSTAGNFTAAAQACSFATTTCTCTGAGSCSAGATVFSCNAAGNCSANTAGRIRFLGAGLSSTTSAVCTLGALSTCLVPTNTISRTVTCNGISPTVTMGYSCAESIATMPAWFTANRWQDYVFYEMTRPTNMVGITVGNKTAGAMVATTGRPINSVPSAAKGSAQVKSSCAVNDYLDSAENLSTNTVYDATSKQRTNNYNDQTFVVAP